MSFNSALESFASVSGHLRTAYINVFQQLICDFKQYGSEFKAVHLRYFRPLFEGILQFYLLDLTQFRCVIVSIAFIFIGNVSENKNCDVSRTSLINFTLILVLLESGLIPRYAVSF